MVRFTRNESSWLSRILIAAGTWIAAVAPARASQWSTPVQPPAGCNSSLAVNASGVMVIAGVSQTGGGLEAFTVQLCTSNDGVSWSGPTPIGQGVAPAVAVARDGRAVVVWQGGPATAPNVQSSVRPPGGSWSAPVVVSSAPGHPVVGMDAAGNVIAAWAPTSTLNEAVETADLPAGGSWTSPLTLVSAGGGVSVAVNSGGEAIVGWRTHANQIQAAAGTTRGGFSAPITIGTTYGGIFFGTQLAINDRGAASLSWRTANTNMVATRTESGSWSNPTQLSANAEGVSTAIDDAGNAIAVFAELQSTGTPTFASRRPPGGTWGPPTLVSALDARGAPALGGDAAGTFVLTWTGGSGAVEAITIPPGGTFGPAVSVGAAPLIHLVVIPGEAVLWSHAGVAKEPVN